MPNAVKKISFFDFDKTLIHSPGPTTGHKVWFEKTGTPWPWQGWWGRQESLDVDVFDFYPIESVISRLKADKARGALTVLLTNRTPTLERSIRRVLDKYGITLDEYTFATSSKPARVAAYADLYRSVELIDVYDDDSQSLALIDTARPTIDAQVRLFLVVEGRLEEL